MNRRIIISINKLALTSVIILFVSLYGAAEDSVQKQPLRSSIFKLSKLPKTRAMGETTKIGKPIVVESSYNKAGIDTAPRVIPINNTMIHILEPGKNNVLLPKVFILPTTEKYRIFGTDTIFQANELTASFPEGIIGSKPKFKDNALFDIRYIDVEQGLPSSYVLSAIEDKDKYLWIGFNDEGVIRYDGNILFHFSPAKGFPLKSVRSILQDSKGNMWFGSFDEGVVKYDGSFFTIYTTKQGLPDNFIYDIHEDNEGSIWFATGNGACKFDGHAMIVYSESEGLRTTSLRSITKDNSGELWFGTWGGHFFKYDGAAFSHYDLKKFGISDNVSKVQFDTKNNKLWIAFNKGYFGSLSNDTLKLYRFPGESQRYKDIVVDNEGIPYISTLAKGFFRFDGKVFEFYSPESGLSNRDVSVLKMLSNGSILAGTRGGGINIYNPFSFKHFTEKQGLKNALVFAISQDKYNHLWFGTETDGIFSYDEQHFMNYTENNGLKSDIILASINDSKSHLWFGAYGGGLLKFEEKSLTNFLKEDGLSDINVASLFEDMDGNIWIGTWGGGAFMYDGRSIIPINESNGLSNGNVLSINQDINRDIWMATEGGGLFRLYSIDLDSKILYNYNQTNGLKSSHFNCITKDAFGNLWFGAHHNGGLYVLTTDQQKLSPAKAQFQRVNLSNKQANQSIQSIVFDNQQRIWLGTDKGLHLLPEVLGENGLTLKSENKTISFLKEDGLIGVDFFRNALFCDAKNRLWMGTGKCLSMIDLDNFNKVENNPEVRIDMLKILNKTIDFKQERVQNQNFLFSTDSTKFKGIIYSGVFGYSNVPIGLAVPYNFNHLTFFFSASDWSAPNKTVYQVMIEGLDHDWTITSENKVDYRNIPHGIYIFKVRAKGLSEEWGAVKTFEFQVLPPFWFRWWAYILYVLVFIGFTILFSRWRSYKLIQHKRELSSLVSLRTTELAAKNSELNQLVYEVSAQRDEIEQQRDMVFQQKQQLERAHNELSNSIDYAVRIQAALFPDKEELKSYFPENFLYLMPRDKVTGDFFFWSKIDNKIIIAVADCTGHGVPGAFMSMLGLTMIREIVNKDKITDTAEILNNLRNEVITALRQKFSPGAQKDGLDIAVVVIDRENRKIQYSGAHNSVYHISKGQLFEYKGDRTSVSVHIKMIPFTSQTFNYKKGDSLYLFTDGFFDQFGGPQQTKLKSRAFKELIQNNVHFDMQIQKERYAQFFELWKGNYEQIDDVALLGIKLQ
jgi:ligand-binding sensor domain-containing protein/serine phosphatase RsbU (regulator of sigma subunit)